VKDATKNQSGFGNGAILGAASLFENIKPANKLFTFYATFSFCAELRQ